jgi:hypothetical protein
MQQRGLLEDLAMALRSPVVPEVFETLAQTGYLAFVWPQLRPSVETAGFLSSALYMADMALDAVLETYEPQLSVEAMQASGVDVVALLGVIDAFRYVQPQSLLLCAALEEAWSRQHVGGDGRAEPRVTTDEEEAHLLTVVRFAPPGTRPLPNVANALQVQYAPELYRAVAVWPVYVEAAWEELQHLAAYPQLRRRARALYYYARSSARFLADPLTADRHTLLASGIAPSALDASHAAIEAALPLTATMMVHCSAMRVGLGVTERALPARP